jgi:hypothetical protein
MTPKRGFAAQAALLIKRRMNIIDGIFNVGYLIKPVLPVFVFEN